jgi:hypothetical protein
MSDKCSVIVTGIVCISVLVLIVAVHYISTSKEIAYIENGYTQKIVPVQNCQIWTKEN